jgi:hypothetical protein
VVVWLPVPDRMPAAPLRVLFSAVPPLRRQRLVPSTFMRLACTFVRLACTWLRFERTFMPFIRRLPEPSLRLKMPSANRTKRRQESDLGRARWTTRGAVARNRFYRRRPFYIYRR